MQRATRQSILVIEANPSLRRLITLGLQHRGLPCVDASTLDGFSVSPAIAPALVVLDIDSDMANSQAPLAQIEAHPTLSALPVVVLTWENDAASTAREEQVSGSAPARFFLSKPFDARALHAAIEQLLLDVQESKIARRQEMYLTSNRTASSPSIWPLVTAIGFLLAMIGLMLQLTVTAIGLLIVIAALLCWTLEPKHKPGPLPI